MMSNIRMRKQQVLSSSTFKADKIGVFWLWNMSERTVCAKNVMLEKQTKEWEKSQCRLVR